MKTWYHNKKYYPLKISSLYEKYSTDHPHTPKPQCMPYLSLLAFFTLVNLSFTLSVLITSCTHAQQGVKWLGLARICIHFACAYIIMCICAHQWNLNAADMSSPPQSLLQAHSFIYKLITQLYSPEAPYAPDNFEVSTRAWIQLAWRPHHSMHTCLPSNPVLILFMSDLTGI